MKLKILNISQPSGNILLILIILTCITGLWGCYPSIKKEAQTPEQALTQVKYFYPKFQDDMDFDSLARAINRNLEYLDSLDPEDTFYYGPHKFTCRQVRNSQEEFLKLILNIHDSKHLNREIKKNFLVYRAAGRVGNRSVLFTGYFEPIFQAKLSPDESYKYPIYSLPDNLIKIDLSQFNSKFKGESITGRIEGKNVLPYYSRKQIEDDKALNELLFIRAPSLRSITVTQPCQHSS